MNESQLAKAIFKKEAVGLLLYEIDEAMSKSDPQRAQFEFIRSQFETTYTLRPQQERVINKMHERVTA